jgi:hypothetical protein
VQVRVSWADGPTAGSRPGLRPTSAPAHASKLRPSSPACRPRHRARAHTLIETGFKANVDFRDVHFDLAGNPWGAFVDACALTAEAGALATLLNPRFRPCEAGTGEGFILELRPNHPNTWIQLSVLRDWTPAQYESWVGDTSCQQLLA